MRGLWKLTVSAVGHGVRCVPFRLHSGRPPAPLGARILTNPDDVCKHNMWYFCALMLWLTSLFDCRLLFVCVPVRYERDAHQYWNGFYERHHNKFFKNRQWLFSEFPELLPPASLSDSPEVLRDFAVKSQETVAFPGQHASFRILEVIDIFYRVDLNVCFIQCLFRDTFLYCIDFSSRAIQLVKHPDYDPAVCHAFVHDVCDGASLFPFPPGSLDVILVVFVLSSIHPERLQGVVNRLASYLKHGGSILFKDYGRYDLAQLRFKKGQCLSDNFYTRQDGTRVYFFTKEEVHQMFTDAGLEEIQNLEDKRLQVNRGKKVVMRRVWIQSKYRKP
uniref:Methyltransferase 8, methylcytidine n=1 Tax=Astyanax mexicanus TaxID=7994 RepID=A0A3B1K3N0_ASTMX